MRQQSSNTRRGSSWRLLGMAAWLVVVIAVGSCRSTPVVSDNMAPPATVEVMNSKNQQVARSAKSVAASAATGSASDSLLQRQLQAMMARGGPHLIADNEVKLLIDGPQAYAAMFASMERAKDHINIEVYILQDDEVGQRLLAMLTKKRQQGVQVKLIYDSLGCLSTPKALFKTLTDAGVEVMEFNPVNPVEGKAFDLNNRDHRKILIVDGVVGYTGGINISSVYSQGSAANRLHRSTAAEPPRDTGWRDTQIEVRGPAVAELQRIFFATWDRRQPSAAPSNASYYPPPARGGDKYVRVIASSPDDEANIIYVDLLTAIRQSQRSVHLTMAYFSPDEQTITALQQAARRGVDVTLVLPGFSDIWLIFEAGRARYSALLKAGVRIYERRDALLHAKTAVIDGVWSTVGSSNMDMRSFLHNYEVNVVVIGSDFGAQMETMFRSDVGQGIEVTKQSWSQRPISARMRQWFSSIWAYWL